MQNVTKYWAKNVLVEHLIVDLSAPYNSLPPLFDTQIIAANWSH